MWYPMDNILTDRIKVVPQSNDQFLFCSEGSVRPGEFAGLQRFAKFLKQRFELSPCHANLTSEGQKRSKLSLFS